jgi:FkbM family methyltransferase
MLYQYERCNVGMHSVARHDDSKPHELVPAVRIDDMNLSALDLLQLDVEGAEAFALRGAEQSLKKFRPVVSVETLTDPVKEILMRHNYHEVGRNSSDTVFVSD